jgi:hypothetical protein
MMNPLALVTIARQFGCDANVLRLLLVQFVGLMSRLLNASFISLGEHMKKSLLALAFLAALTPLHSNAQTAAAPAAEPASPLAGNLAIVSDYRFRGISQSYRLPAVQGGIDYAHESGFYLGNWNSSVSGNQFPNGASL